MCWEKANDVMFPVFQPTFQLLQKGRARGKHFNLQGQSRSCCLCLARVGAPGAEPHSWHFWHLHASLAWLFLLLPHGWAAQAQGLDGRQHSHPCALLWWGWSSASRGTVPWHSPVPGVCRAAPELALLPAREPLTLIKAKFTLTF